MDRDAHDEEVYGLGGAEDEAQICTECGELTARSGSDSLCCRECGAGPFCDACYTAHRGEHREQHSAA